MTRLQLVADGVAVPNDRHSVNVDDLAAMERLVEVAWLPARQALSEMESAIERRDVNELIAACRRLSSAGELARLTAIRLEGGTT